MAFSPSDQEQVIWNLSSKYQNIPIYKMGWGEETLVGVGRNQGDCWQCTVRPLMVTLGESGCVCHQLSPCLVCLQLWVEERLPLAQSADYGTNLQTVQLFMKKNQVSLASPGQGTCLAGK